MATALERLTAQVNYVRQKDGRFIEYRWHHPHEWARIAERLPLMDEAAAQAQLDAIERAAQHRLDMWKVYQ